MKRARKEEQFSVRLDAKLRIALDKIKEIYKYDTDPEAMVPILETRLKEYYSTEEYKALIRALMDDILNEECDGNE
jgi:predicted AAA+ superfamily ATPase